MKLGNVEVGSNLAKMNAALAAPVRCALQMAALAGMAWIGHLAVAHLHLPLSGNLAGMLLTFGALQLGIVRLEHLDAGATLLVRHLPLLFIPLIVAVSGLGAPIASQGVAILATLVVSAAVGFAVAGRVAQGLLPARREGPPPMIETKATSGKSRG